MGFFKSKKGSIISDYFKLLVSVPGFSSGNMYDIALYDNHLEMTSILSKFIFSVDYSQIINVEYSTPYIKKHGSFFTITYIDSLGETNYLYLEDTRRFKGYKLSKKLKSFIECNSNKPIDMSLQQAKNILLKDTQSSCISQDSYIPVGDVSIQSVSLTQNIITSLRKRYIAFDVETTGLSPDRDRIIEIGAIIFECGKVIDSYSTLINIGFSIPSAASSVNHITDEMLESAPSENVVYPELINFLGDALTNDTILCAHNAIFDMNFLSQTLMRLGYNGNLRYIDTLSLSRELIKGLPNYKQNTVASYFDLMNSQSHRAAADAEICGKILYKLLDIENEQFQQRKQAAEKSKPTNEELEVCAFIQNCITERGGDIDYLGFCRNSGNYVNVSYMYSILKFKFSKKGAYIIVEKDILNENMSFVTAPCSKSEGTSEWVRVFFENPYSLEPLADYFFKLYSDHRNSALDYLNSHKAYIKELKNSPALLNTLSSEDVTQLLTSARKRLSLE